jgi:hypothetical protein
MNMKRTWLWVIGTGVIISVGLLTVEQGYADDATRRTLDTLKGQYLFSASGTLFPPAFGVTEKSQSNAAGYHIFNGDGTGTDVLTFRINGVTVPVTSPLPFTYTLKPDCTGTVTVPSGPLHFDIFAALDGEEVAYISTDQGFAESDGPQRRVRSSR